jgi:hypothetical protein
MPPHFIHYEQVPFRIRSDRLRQLCRHCDVSVPPTSIRLRDCLRYAKETQCRNWDIYLNIQDPVFRRSPERSKAGVAPQFPYI